MEMPALFAIERQRPSRLSLRVQSGESGGFSQQPQVFGGQAGACSSAVNAYGGKIAPIISVARSQNVAAYAAPPLIRSPIR